MRALNLLKRRVVRQHSILGLVRGRLARMRGDNAGETPAHRFEPTLILELGVLLVMIDERKVIQLVI